MCTQITSIRISQVMLVVENLPANAGDLRDTGSIPESGRSLGGGHGNPFQYSCLENPMDRGAWWTTVHKVTQSWTQLKWFSTQTHMHVHTHTWTHGRLTLRQRKYGNGCMSMRPTFIIIYCSIWKLLATQNVAKASEDIPKAPGLDEL